MPDSIEQYRSWVGRKQRTADIAAASPAARLAATLDRKEPPPKAGDALPPGWHWLYFLDAVPMSAIGADGHAARGEFLPPIPLPRRMYAGGRFRFERPLRVGEAIEREIEITDVALKQGRTGPLAFVTLRHTVFDRAGICLVEEQDIVYREAARPDEKPTPPQPPPADAAFGRAVAPDPVLLFRFSALTFNGHRIHYDQPYVTKVEGYPGLIVHGPLLAILLLDLIRRQRPEATLARFAFRSFRPVFDISPFKIAGRPEAGGLALWAEDNGGALAMKAEASFA
jgi:3-methylfumaryl-CoA hydratase